MALMVELTGLLKSVSDSGKPAAYDYFIDWDITAQGNTLMIVYESLLGR